MPDDNRNLTADMRRRGAEPVTLRAPLGEGGRMVRAASWRLQSGHPDMHVIDRMGMSGELDPRLYANACALLKLWLKAGGSPQVSADYEPYSGGGGHEGEEGPCFLSIYNHTMAALHRHYQFVLTGVLHGGHPGALLPNLRSALDLLDYLPARWDGEIWRAER